MSLKIFEEKRVYFNPDKAQYCFVYYMGGKHGSLNVSKLVCERYLNWEEGEWTETVTLNSIPKDWEKVGTTRRDSEFLSFAKYMKAKEVITVGKWYIGKKGNKVYQALDIKPSGAVLFKSVMKTKVKGKIVDNHKFQLNYPQYKNFIEVKR